jgi:hypothetical protein
MSVAVPCADGMRDDSASITISPEPTPAEGDAIAAALDELGRDGAEPGRSAWWRAGVRENVEPPE